MRCWLELAIAVTTQDMPLFRRVAREQGWTIAPKHFDYQSALTACGLNSAGIAVRPNGRLTVNAQSVQELLEAMVKINGMAVQPEWFFMGRGQAALFCLLGHLGSALDQRNSAKYFRAALTDCENRFSFVRTN